MLRPQLVFSVVEYFITTKIWTKLNYPDFPVGIALIFSSPHIPPGCLHKLCWRLFRIPSYRFAYKNIELVQFIPIFWVIIKMVIVTFF
jgi:hypothetical protein